MAEQPCVEIVGVHGVVAETPCALASDWQVPYDEKLLDETGESIAQDGGAPGCRS